MNTNVNLDAQSITVGNEEITKDFERITVDSVQDGANPEKSKIAILKQVVVTTYPATKAGNSKTSSLFSTESFGVGSQYGNRPGDKPRASLIKIPVDADIDDVKAQIEALYQAGNQPRLYKILSNDVMDVLTDEQKDMIPNADFPEITLVSYKAKKTVRDGDTQEPILDKNGRIQYGSTYFSHVLKEDEDYRMAPTRTQVSQEPAENFLTGDVNADAEATFDANVAGNQM